MIGKILKAVKVAGPAVAGFAAGGPAGAVLAVTGQLAGAGEVVRAKKSDQRKDITAPAAAIAAPTLLASLLTVANVPGADQIASGACGSPEAAGATFGTIAFMVNHFVRRVEKATTAG